jgi:hypothetical protein
MNDGPLGVDLHTTSNSPSAKMTAERWIAVVISKSLFGLMIKILIR